MAPGRKNFKDEPEKDESDIKTVNIWDPNEDLLLLETILSQLEDVPYMRCFGGVKRIDWNLVKFPSRIIVESKARLESILKTVKKIRTLEEVITAYIEEQRINGLINEPDDDRESSSAKLVTKFRIFDVQGARNRGTVAMVPDELEKLMVGVSDAVDKKAIPSVSERNGKVIQQSSEPVTIDLTNDVRSHRRMVNNATKPPSRVEAVTQVDQKMSECGVPTDKKTSKRKKPVKGRGAVPKKKPVRDSFNVADDSLQ